MSAGSHAAPEAVMSDAELKALLDREAARINSPEFIADDPVQFARLYTRPEDIEIASLLAATLAWGNRTMICRDCHRLMALMEHRPLDYVLDEGYEELDPAMNIHRTFFARNLQHYLRGLRRIYTRHGSLQAFAAHAGIAGSEAPSWTLAEAMARELAEANGTPAADCRCLPGNLGATALKRLNMALRWLVRRDGIVDLGIWDVITPAQLYIPLDVHVGNVSRQMGLLTRRSNDRRAVIELTARLRAMRPDDPVVYDYALFGLGVENKKAGVRS